MIPKKNCGLLLEGPPARSLPLDSCRWLGGDVVGDAVHAAHFVDDLVGNFGKEVVGEAGPVGSHGVGGGNGAECHGAFIGAFIAHNAHALYGEEYHSGLPYLVI